jgi:hypothetical protein
MTKEKLLGSTAQLDAPASGTPDNLVPDPVVCAEFGVTAMTLWRWERDPELNFPPAIVIRKRKFRSRLALEAFKQRLIANATKPSASTTPRPQAKRRRARADEAAS